MLHYTQCVTLDHSGGRIWSKKPKVAITGLLTVLQTPSSNVSSAVRSSEFTSVVFDSKADHLATTDSRGNVYVFSIKQNRYMRIDKAGAAGTVACFSNTNLRRLFVACSVSGLECGCGCTEPAWSSQILTLTWLCPCTGLHYQGV